MSTMMSTMTCGACAPIAHAEKPTKSACTRCPACRRRRGANNFRVGRVDDHEDQHVLHEVRVDDDIDNNSTRYVLRLVGTAVASAPRLGTKTNSVLAESLRTNRTCAVAMIWPRGSPLQPDLVDSAPWQGQVWRLVRTGLIATFLSNSGRTATSRSCPQPYLLVWDICKRLQIPMMKKNTCTKTVLICAHIAGPGDEDARKAM